MHYTLCDLFSDLTENAVNAGASVITVELDEDDSRVSVRIADNGKGMSPDQLRKATDPFWTDGIKHPGRKVGLGIPFLIQTAEMTGGTWNISSMRENDAPSGERTSRGTTVSCSFDLTNIDTPPVGDVTGFFRQILTFDGPYEMVITRRSSRTGYTVSRSELLEALGLENEGAFTDAASLALLGQYLESMEE